MIPFQCIIAFVQVIVDVGWSMMVKRIYCSTLIIGTWFTMAFCSSTCITWLRVGSL